MHHRSMALGFAAASLVILSAVAGSAAEQAAPAPYVHLFDTGTHLPAALPAEALARKDSWAEVGRDGTDHKFVGDAVLVNDRLALVVRAGGPGLEVYSMGGASPRLRTILAPAAAGPLKGLSSLKATAVSPEAVALEAVYHVEGGPDVGLAVGLKMGEPQVKTEPRGGLKALLVQAPCRLAVLPDFFADDIVIDAAQLKVPQAELPAENMLLHMMPDHNAIVMAVWNTSHQDVQVALSGQGDHRTITSTRIEYGEDPAVWVSVLEAPGVWHERDVAVDEAGKVIRLDWRAPWPGHWRADWTRSDGLVDSWEMLSQNQDGSYTKPNWFGSREKVPADRQRWTTVLGNFKYPCWIKQDGQGYLEPLTQPGDWNTRQVVQFRGPALIYPMNRLSATPLDTFTVLDVVRTTLGVGPCQYILDTEAGKSTNKGMATCATKERLDGIYASGRQKEQRAQVEKSLADVITFIKFIRSRIDTYVQFGHDSLSYLAEQKAQHPELAGELAELEDLAKTIDVRVAQRRDLIKTPQYAEQLAEQFRQTVLDKDDADAPARCQKITAAWVEMGGNQDHLAGECRWAVKFLRQRAGLLMAEDPRLSDICHEVMSRAQAAMAEPAGHEAIHH
jgi:hypothetical protein